jgi:hypothetical protein
VASFRRSMVDIGIANAVVEVAHERVTDAV